METLLRKPRIEELERSSILVVDDENGPRLALRMLLKEDHDVQIAVDVAEAQAILSTTNVDLVITDIRMPKQTGVDLLHWLKQYHPDVEAIILTGYGQLETAMKAVELGAFAYLEKPFDNETMMRYVNDALEKRRIEMERRRLEDLALEANRFETVGRFVSGILHDLGTPLSVIGSQLELIARAPKTDGIEKRLQLIQAQSDHCSELVRKAMSFLRHQTQSFAPININEIVLSCFEVAKPILTKQKIEFSKELCSSVPVCTGDFVLVRQALLNLIINACQAMENQEEKRHIHIMTWVADGHICLSVTDTGPGIPPQNQAKVFQAFFTTKTKTGTGLGLAAVKNIMRRHKGTVYLIQHDGRGASFGLRFPIARP